MSKSKSKMDEAHMVAVQVATALRERDPLVDGVLVIVVRGGGVELGVAAHLCPRGDLSRDLGDVLHKTLTDKYGPGQDLSKDAADAAKDRN